MKNTSEWLAKKVAKHGKWLDTKGRKGKPLFLSRGNYSSGGFLSMEGANLGYARFNNISAQKSDFDSAVLSDASLAHSDFYESEFIGVTANRASFVGARMDGCSFDNAALCFTDFRETSLHGASFVGARCQFARFRGADLTNVDFEDANLQYADFRQSDLKDACLRGADLSYAIGDMKYIKTLAFDKWTIVYTHDRLFIGTAHDSIEGWFNRTDAELLGMRRLDPSLPRGKEMLNWWHKYRPILSAMIATSPCEKTVS